MYVTVVETLTEAYFSKRFFGVLNKKGNSWLAGVPFFISNILVMCF
jgi:hypothetical protein